MNYKKIINDALITLHLHDYAARNDKDYPMESDVKELRQVISSLSSLIQKEENCVTSDNNNESSSLATLHSTEESQIEQIRKGVIDLQNSIETIIGSGNLHSRSGKSYAMGFNMACNKVMELLNTGTHSTNQNE